MTDKCDICSKKTNCLSDYYAMICQECRETHTDMVLIMRIGQLMNKIEDMETEKSTTRRLLEIERCVQFAKKSSEPDDFIDKDKKVSRCDTIGKKCDDVAECCTPYKI